MTNQTPNSKIAEILAPWLDEITSEYGTGINDEKKPQFIAIAEAATQLQQLIIEARIDELNNVWASTDGGVCTDLETDSGLLTVRKRIANLQAQLNKEVE